MPWQLQTNPHLWTTSTQKLITLFGPQLNAGIPLLLASVPNAKHRIWWCQKHNQRGNTLSEFLATTELQIVNKGCKYEFCSGNKRSVIDIMLATRSLLPYLHDYQVDSQDTMSDHRQICLYRLYTRPPLQLIHITHAINAHDFYRATLCVSTVFAVIQCPSVMLVYSIQMAEDIVKLFFWPGSPTILVFDPQHRYPIPTGTHSAWAQNTRSGGKICDFRLKSVSISETVRDRPMVAMEH